MRVECFSLKGFRWLEPRQRWAVISIRDDGHTDVELGGWGPSIVSEFLDVEYDKEYVERWGWKLAKEDGMFMPDEARRLASFIRSEAVRGAEGLAVHCYAGRSRSVAVGQFAAEVLGWELVVHEKPEPNRSVAKLLRDPDWLGNPTAAQSQSVATKPWWRKLF